MHEINQTAQVRYRIDALIAEAAAARLAACRRRLGATAGHSALPPHDGLAPHDGHEPARARRVVGRLLIGLGTAIAGNEAGAGAGHAT